MENLIEQIQVYKKKQDVLEKQLDDFRRDMEGNSFSTYAVVDNLNYEIAVVQEKIANLKIEIYLMLLKVENDKNKKGALKNLIMKEAHEQYEKMRVEIKHLEDSGCSQEQINDAIDKMTYYSTIELEGMGHPTDTNSPFAILGDISPKRKR